MAGVFLLPFHFVPLSPAGPRNFRPPQLREGRCRFGVCSDFRSPSRGALDYAVPCERTVRPQRSGGVRRTCAAGYNPPPAPRCYPLIPPTGPRNFRLRGSGAWERGPRLSLGFALTLRRRSYYAAATSPTFPRHSDSRETVVAPLVAFGSLLGSSPTRPHHRQTHIRVRLSVLAAVHGGSRGLVTGSFAK
jgi:hypothetical protein